MTLRQQWLIVGAIVVVILVALTGGAYVMRDQLFPVEVGSLAPPFEARTVDGSNQVRRFKDYRGKVLVLNVWATWCEPCRQEMPSFELLHQAFAGTDLRIVGLSIDDIVGADSVRRYAKGLNLSFEILLDSLHHADRDYQVTGYPETFVIARDGTIRKKWIGAANWTSEANVTLIRELLGLPPAARAPGREQLPRP